MPGLNTLSESCLISPSLREVWGMIEPMSHSYLALLYDATHAAIRDVDLLAPDSRTTP